MIVLTLIIKGGEIVGRKALNLTPDEKKARRAAANKRYYERAKKDRDKVKKFQRSTLKSHCYNFIKHDATRAELSEVRDLVAERVKILMQEKNNSKNT